jgi:hypothetical protein
MKAALVEVSGEFLRELLHMPEGARIIGVGAVDESRETVTLIVEHDDLPDAELPHEANPTVTHTREAFTWHWNIEDAR